jgi:hypothetical protein
MSEEVTEILIILQDINVIMYDLIREAVKVNVNDLEGSGRGLI